MPQKLPDGYKLASVRFHIPIGSVASKPLSDSRFLPPEAHRERCWLAYAEALNTDREPSRNGLKTFPVEYKELFSTRREHRGQSGRDPDLSAFAERWGLRPEDLEISLRLSESRWQRTGELAGFEPPQRLSLVPSDLRRAITWQVSVEYDPTEMTRSETRAALQADLAGIEKELSNELDEIEALAADRGLRQIPSHHRSWDQLLATARRLVLHRKGWSWKAIGEADDVAERVAARSVRRFEATLNS